MKKACVFVCLIFAVCSITAQVHIPLSKTLVGFWQLSKGTVHGNSETTGMFSVYNPDGTFYMFTIGGKEQPKATMLQCGTYTLTSDSTCNQLMVKSFTMSSAGEGQKFQVRFQLVNDVTMIWKYSTNGLSWSTEVWSRVE